MYYMLIATTDPATVISPFTGANNPPAVVTYNTFVSLLRLPNLADVGSAMRVEFKLPTTVVTFPVWTLIFSMVFAPPVTTNTLPSLSNNVEGDPVEISLAQVGEVQHVVEDLHSIGCGAAEAILGGGSCVGIVHDDSRVSSFDVDGVYRADVEVSHDEDVFCFTREDSHAVRQLCCWKVGNLAQFWRVGGNGGIGCDVDAAKVNAPDGPRADLTLASSERHISCEDRKDVRLVLGNTADTLRPCELVNKNGLSSLCGIYQPELRCGEDVDEDLAVGADSEVLDECGPGKLI
ncbi:hypothetical protein VP1G_10784 [Cytospora mali]|uniref:Uncharacterized protein n=1 Tax=Cytospora mali TaxID=578113 RepID=A0A194UWH8_CYTMA|nr:hypothetical protein VP1G_10784 [Valsa mali var. pyri (nom. inval.)]